MLSAEPEPVNASASYRRRLLSSNVLDESRMRVEEQLSGPHRAKLQACQHSAAPFLQQHIFATVICRKSSSRCHIVSLTEFRAPVLQNL